MYADNLIQRSKLRAMSLKTKFRYSVLVNLQREYPKNVDAAEAIFIHIPKTAGTSLYNLIGYTGIGHVPYDWYETRDRDKFKRYFKFAFVRNPWDRLVSAFLYLKRGGSNAMDEQWGKSNLGDYDTFEDFVKNWVTDDNVERYFHFIPQYRFIYDQELVLKVDFVGRFENIQADFDVVANKLGIAERLPYVNKSQRKAYQTYYTDETRDIVSRVYRQDLELFNYQFDRNSVI